MSRLGSFEIMMNGVVLSSKIKSQVFPDVASTVKYLLKFREEMTNSENRPDVIDKYKSAASNFNKTSSSFRSRSSKKSLMGGDATRSRSFFSLKQFKKPFVNTFNP